MSNVRPQIQKNQFECYVDKVYDFLYVKNFPSFNLESFEPPLRLSKITKESLRVDDEFVKSLRPFMYSPNILMRPFDFKEPTIGDRKRRIGDCLMKSENYIEALKCYTESVAHAYYKTNLLAQAFISRAHALVKLNLMNDCVESVQQYLDMDSMLHFRFIILTTQGEYMIRINRFMDAKKVLREAIIRTDLTNLGIDTKTKWISSLHKHITFIDNGTYHATIKEEGCSPGCGGGSFVEGRYWCGKERNSSESRPNLPTFDKNQINPEIPCASNSVELRYNISRGRHLVATRDIAPGEVLIVERPYTSLLLEPYKLTHCYHCLYRCLALLPCPICSRAMFCSKACLEKAWVSHQLECKVMHKLNVIKADNSVSLALKILACTGIKRLEALLEEIRNSPVDLRGQQTDEELRRAGFTGNQFVPNLSTILMLQYNKCYNNSLSKLRLGLLAIIITDHFAQYLNNSSGLEGVVMRLIKNCHQMVHEVTYLVNYDNKESNEQHGIGCYPVFDLLNHDCDPSCCSFMYGDVKVLRAIKLINKGEEITVSYCCSFRDIPRIDRQRMLQQKYGFECKCQACTENWPTHSFQPAFPDFLPEWKRTLVYNSYCSLPDPIRASCYHQLCDTLAHSFKEHMILLCRLGGRICKDFNACQQAIITYYSRQGNYYSSLILPDPPNNDDEPDDSTRKYYTGNVPGMETAGPSTSK